MRKEEHKKTEIRLGDVVVITRNLDNLYVITDILWDDSMREHQYRLGVGSSLFNERELKIVFSREEYAEKFSDNKLYPLDHERGIIGRFINSFIHEECTCKQI